MAPWAVGDRIIRREVWRDRPLSEMPVTVVQDSAGLLVVHLAEGALARRLRGLGLLGRQVRTFDQLGRVDAGPDAV